MRLPGLRPIVLALLMTSCAAPQIRSSTADLVEKAPFLQVGATRLEDALRRMGEPFARHEADRVFVWRGRAGDDGRLRFGRDAGSGSIHEVVLQFDAEGVLRRGSLVHAE